MASPNADNPEDATPPQKKKEAHGLLELINLVNSEKLYKGDNINI